MQKTLIILLIVLSALTGVAQPKVLRKATVKADLCSSSLTLFNDSTYLYETGCEERSHVNFGTWKKSKRLYTLTPIDTSNFEAVSSIVKTPRQQTDSLICITVMDVYNRPVSEFEMEMVFQNNDAKKSTYALKSVASDSCSIKIIGRIETDDNGKACVLLSDQPAPIRLSGVGQIFRRDIVLDPALYKSNNLMITLNLHRQVFMYPVISWIELPSRQVKICKKKIQFGID